MCGRYPGCNASEPSAGDASDIDAGHCEEDGHACEQYARGKGWKIIVAIVDAGGVLKQFSRMDDSFMISVEISQIKAHTSAGVPVSSRKFGEIAKANPGLELVPNTATFAGGLPIITASGAHIGGIGVSGASGDQDEECAQVALDAVKDVLK